MTVEQVKADITKLLARYTKQKKSAESDGNSDYAYYSGVTDAYEVALFLLNKIDLSEKGK